MYTCLVYVPHNLRHIKVKVDIPEDEDWKHLRNIEILPAIIRILQEKEHLRDNSRVTILAIDILWQYVLDPVTVEHIEDLINPQA